MTYLLHSVIPQRLCATGTCLFFPYDPVLLPTIDGGKMAEVRFQQISKSFGEVPVIDSLDLTIADGEFFTFVGPSGCGKSTILNLIAGLELPSAGAIFFDGDEITNVTVRKRDVAMVFQSYALYPHLSVADNIGFPLKMKKIPKDQIKTEVAKTAESLGLGDYLQRRPRELSGGQRQRVALARAIIRRPRVFLMDEPLSNLDAKLRIEMRAELKRLHRQLKITTIYVTHDQSEAMGLSERIAVLHDGVVQQCGTPDEVYARPKNRFVAGFLGSPPMNFLPGKIDRKNQAEVVVNDQSITIPTNSQPASGEVVLGIRPEDVVISTADGHLTGEVQTVEFVGSGSWVELRWGEMGLKGFSARLTPVQPGERLSFTIPAEKCYLFNKTTGDRL